MKSFSESISIINTCKLLSLKFSPDARCTYVQSKWSERTYSHGGVWRRSCCSLLRTFEWGCKLQTLLPKVNIFQDDIALCCQPVIDSVLKGNLVLFSTDTWEINRDTKIHLHRNCATEEIMNILLFLLLITLSIHSDSYSPHLYKVALLSIDQTPHSQLIGPAFSE